jgi:glycerophosphoryl diester phosphodiesterase
MKTFDINRLVAHRGDHEYAPENSLEAFRTALDAGALWLECDVQLTRDAVPVIFHDENLQRLCGLEDNLCELPYARLPLLADGQPIPTLQELLVLLSDYPRATLFLEVKTDSLPYYPLRNVAAKLGGMIHNNGQVIPIGFSAELLEYWWQTRPQRLGWIGDETERAPHIPLSFLFMSSDAFLQRGRPTIGEQIGVYTVNDGLLARQLLQNGADLIETDYFSRLQGLMANG